MRLQFRQSLFFSLFLVSGFWFVFSLLSGAEGFGGGLKGILINSPNSLPWLILLGLVYLAKKWSMLGGSLVVLFGLVTLIFFKTYQDVIVFSLVSLPILVFGGVLVLIQLLKKTS